MTCKFCGFTGKFDRARRNRITNKGFVLICRSCKGPQ